MLTITTKRKAWKIHGDVQNRKTWKMLDVVETELLEALEDLCPYSAVLSRLAKICHVTFSEYIM